MATLWIVDGYLSTPNLENVEHAKDGSPSWSDDHDTTHLVIVYMKD